MGDKRRSDLLRQHHSEVGRLSTEAQQAFLAAEDALSSLEEREGRRAARRAVNQSQMDALRQGR